MYCFIRTLLLVFLFSISWFGQAQSQEQVKVKLNIKPSNAIVYIDSIKIKATLDSVKLDTGQHQVRVWAPQKKLVEREVRIQPTGKQAIGVSLPPSDAYRTYRRQKANYIGQVFMTKYVFIPAAIVTAGVSTERIISLGNQMEEQRKLTEAARQEYNDARTINTTIGAVSRFEQSEAEYQKLRQNRNDWIVAMSVAVPVGIASFVLIRLGTDLVLPEYKESPLLSKTDFYLQPVPNGGAMGFCYHF